MKLKLFIFAAIFLMIAIPIVEASYHSRFRYTGHGGPVYGHFYPYKSHYYHRSTYDYHGFNTRYRTHYSHPRYTYSYPHYRSFGRVSYYDRYGNYRSSNSYYAPSYTHRSARITYHPHSYGYHERIYLR